jgi:hypothetical protein
VDLRGVDILGVPQDAVAMQLFISNASFHRACADGNPHTAVRFLREQDLDRGVYQGSLPRRSLYRWSRRFSLVPIDVPGDVFDVPELDLPADDPLVALYEAIGPRGSAAAWAESSPTLPWQGARAPVPGSFVDESSHTVAYEPIRVNEGRVTESSRTVPYDPRRNLRMRADRLLERSRARGGAHEAGPPFLMQFQRRFADVDLGQRGVMFVSGCSAYVDAH